MDIPGHGVVSGQWDLRRGLDDYLGRYNFNGKRVLDVGAASGLVTFHIEKQGAEVVSYDLSDDFDWDIVPFAQRDRASDIGQRREHIRRINNGYWFCHRAYQSRARAVYGVVYDIPQTIGPVDVAIYASILLHLRDPFLALQNGARLAREAMIVADVSPWGRLGGLLLKSPRFMPNHLTPDDFYETWQRLPPRLVKEYLAILGFEKSVITWSSQLFLGRRWPIYTIIARR
jgi:SAM-dependent methyltransferase